MGISCKTYNSSPSSENNIQIRSAFQSQHLHDLDEKMHGGQFIFVNFCSHNEWHLCERKRTWNTQDKVKTTRAFNYIKWVVPVCFREGTNILKFHSISQIWKNCYSDSEKKMYTGYNLIIGKQLEKYGCP